ncbi:MAG: hypothetical protein PHI90_10085 [Clostridia bacterium]|nr:hypothetical protein [Clostridia bacterium]
MQISKERIEEFKRIYKEKSGEELSDDEAYDAAYRLVGFVKLAYDFYIEEKIQKKN